MSNELLETLQLKPPKWLEEARQIETRAREAVDEAADALREKIEAHEAASFWLQDCEDANRRGQIPANLQETK
jgi:hypothetical protein